MKCVACTLLLAALAGCRSEASMPEQVTLCGLVGATVTPSSASLSVGDTLRFRASSSSGGCTPRGPFIFSWHSSNVSIATVDSISGLVTARSAGTATIVAAATTDAAFAAAAVIQVKN